MKLACQYVRPYYSEPAEKRKKEEKKDKLTSTTSPEPNAPAHHITLYPNEAEDRERKIRTHVPQCLDHLYSSAPHRSPASACQRLVSTDPYIHES